VRLRVREPWPLLLAQRSQSPTNKSVRERLEELATELLRSAASEQATDPESAKKKLHQIQGMVDPKSPTYAKATKQLSGL